MLKRTELNFIGNLEGKEVSRGNADVIVCDGFIGNVALKISESLAEMIGANLKEMFTASLGGKLGYLLLKDKLTEEQRKCFKDAAAGIKERAESRLLGCDRDELAFLRQPPQSMQQKIGDPRKIDIGIAGEGGVSDDDDRGPPPPFLLILLILMMSKLWRVTL